MFITDTPYQAYVSFNNAMFNTLLFCIVQTRSPLWILIVGLVMIIQHMYFPTGSVGATQQWVAFVKGFFGKDGSMCLMDFLMHTLLQFAGSLVGTVVYCLIMDEASGPMFGTTGSGLTDGRVFFIFLLANMFQSWAFSVVDWNCKKIQTCFIVAATYMMTWMVAGVAIPNALGGLTFDFARMVGSELVHGDKYQFNKFWIVLAGTAAGWILGPLFVHVIDAKLKAMEDGKKNDGDKPAASPASKEEEERV